MKNDNDKARQAMQVLQDRVALMTEIAKTADDGPLHDELVEINAELCRAVRALEKERNELQVTVDTMFAALDALDAAA